MTNSGPLALLHCAHRAQLFQRLRTGPPRDGSSPCLIAISDQPPERSRGAEHTGPAWLSNGLLPLLSNLSKVESTQGRPVCAAGEIAVLSIICITKEIRCAEHWWRLHLDSLPLVCDLFYLFLYLYPECTAENGPKCISRFPEFPVESQATRVWGQTLNSARQSSFTVFKWRHATGKKTIKFPHCLLLPLNLLYAFLIFKSSEFNIWICITGYLMKEIPNEWVMAHLSLIRRKVKFMTMKQ